MFLRPTGRISIRPAYSLMNCRFESSTSTDHSYLKYGNCFTLHFFSVYAVRLIFRLCFDFIDRDPGPHFLKGTNRDLLRNITRMDVNRVFQSRPLPGNQFSYKFLTADEVRQKFETSLRQARKLLQMPPIVAIENDKTEIISKDPALQGLTDSTLIVTDITFNINDTDREILMRKPNGNLETAPPNVRRRIIQTYFPKDGRKVIVPKMFENEHLKRCLNEGNYAFVLNRACVQFEPYDCDYHRVTALTYQHISDNNAFDVLRSTRHFGPMVFYLAWHKIIDNLLIDCIQRDYLRNAVQTIYLSYSLNDIPYDSYILQLFDKTPERNDEYYYRKLIEKNDDTDEDIVRFDIEKTVGKTNEEIKLDNICLKFIESYAKDKANKNRELKTALQTYREKSEEKRKLLEGLQKAHGVNN